MQKCVETPPFLAPLFRAFYCVLQLRSYSESLLRKALAGFLGGWPPSWEHSEAGTSLYHPYKRSVYVPCGGRSSRRPGGWMTWKASSEALGLLEWDYELVSRVSR